MAKTKERTTEHINTPRTPEERKVFRALTNKRWQLRSVGGIAKETGLNERMVRHILDNNPDEVRVSAVPTTGGDLLYAPRSRPVSGREKLALFRIFLTKSIS